MTSPYLTDPRETEAIAAALKAERWRERKGVIMGACILAAFILGSGAIAYYGCKSTDERRAYWAQPVGYTVEVNGTKLLVTAYDAREHKYNALALAPQPAAVILDPNFVHNAWESSQKVKVEK